MRGLFASVRDGLRVVGSELCWLGLGALSRLELRRLEKRRDEEYARLGRATAAGDAAEAELARKQVAFLDEEIAAHHAEAKHARQDYVKRRRQAWGLDDNP